MYTHADKYQSIKKATSTNQHTAEPTFQIEDNRSSYTIQRNLKKLASHSSQARSLAQLQALVDRRNAMDINSDNPDTPDLASMTGAGILQLKTEVIHTSGAQSYLTSSGETERQLVGRSMDAYLDPHDPLTGSESSAFSRHGIYTDPAFKDDNNRGPTAMHLLNAHLGGLAVDENLFPQRPAMNNAHKDQIENNAKARLLTLGEYTADQLDGARVYYGIQVVSANQLTPQNLSTASNFLAFGPRYVDKNNSPITEWETNVVPATLNDTLGQSAWLATDTHEVSRGNKQDLNSINYDGPKNSYMENVVHENETGDATRRTHIHHSTGFFEQGVWDPQQADF